MGRTKKRNSCRSWQIDWYRRVPCRQAVIYSDKRQIFRLLALRDLYVRLNSASIDGEHWSLQDNYFGWWMGWNNRVDVVMEILVWIFVIRGMIAQPINEDDILQDDLSHIMSWSFRHTNETSMQQDTSLRTDSSFESEEVVELIAQVV